MQRLEVSGAVRPIYGSLGFKRLMDLCFQRVIVFILHLYQLTKTRLVESHGQSRVGFKCSVLRQKGESFPLALLLLKQLSG